MDRADHSTYSSYREMLLEHLFAGEVMRRVWLTGTKRLEILKPQVDDGGYDLVLEARGVVRHIQLKATYRGSTVKRFKVHTALREKPSGCVIVVLFDEETLALGPFHWFGAMPCEKLPSLEGMAVAKHTKGNAEGVKLDRPNIRVLPIARFEVVQSFDELVDKLFGPCTANG